MKFLSKRNSTNSSEEGSYQVTAGTANGMTELGRHSGRMREASTRTLAVDVQMRNKSSSVLNLNLPDSGAINKKPPAKKAFSKMLSTLYAISIILAGFMLPLTEALRDRWHESVYNLIFQILLFTVAIVFLLYLQLRMIPLSTAKQRKHQQEERENRKNNRAGAIIKSTSTGSLYDANNPATSARSSELPPDQNNRFSNGSNLTSDGAPIRGRSPQRRSGWTAGSARLRVNNSLPSFYITPPATRKSDVKMAPETRGLDEGALDFIEKVDIVGEGQEGEVEEQLFIDLSKLGNAFSHHGSNLYLRLGALLFSLCNIVYIGLEIENSVRLRLDKGCAGLNYWWIFIFRLVFLFIQSFLIFKNISVEICVQQPFARFGFMHLIATNMCVWLHTIINEIKEEYHWEESQHTGTSNNHSDAHDDTVFVTGDHYETTTDPGFNQDCQYYTGILRGASPYLYPFVLEYSLIAIGMVAFMASSVYEGESSNMIRGIHNLIQVQGVNWEQASKDDTSSLSSSNHSDGGHGVNFKKSHRGMFAGALLMAGTSITIFLFYYMKSESDLIYFSTDLTMHTFLLCATAIGLYNLNKLEFIEKPTSIDDVLIMIAMSGSFLYEITLIIPSAAYLEYDEDPAHDPRYDVEVIKLTSAVVAAVQTLAQSVLVISGMRRFPIKEQHLKEMPGRGTITFLIFGNVVVWISRTLQAKQVSYTTEQDYYGLIASLLLLDTNLPLLLFFRFHSSVCLAEIWSSAYTAIERKMKHYHQHHHYYHHYGNESINNSVNRLTVTSDPLNNSIRVGTEAVFLDSSGNWVMAQKDRPNGLNSNSDQPVIKSASWSDSRRHYQSRHDSQGRARKSSHNSQDEATKSNPNEGQLKGDGSPKITGAAVGSSRGRVRSYSGDPQVGASSFYSGIDIIHEVDEMSKTTPTVPSTPDVEYHIGDPVSMRSFSGRSEPGTEAYDKESVSLESDTEERVERRVRKDTHTRTEQDIGLERDQSDSPWQYASGDSGYQQF